MNKNKSSVDLIRRSEARGSLLADSMLLADGMLLVLIPYFRPALTIRFAAVPVSSLMGYWRTQGSLLLQTGRLHLLGSMHVGTMYHGQSPPLLAENVTYVPNGDGQLAHNTGSSN